MRRDRRIAGPEARDDKMTLPARTTNTKSPIAIAMGRADAGAPADGVLRRRILERIFAEPAPQVVLMQAPAGHGKTTLLQQVRRRIASDGAVTGWLSLDEGDNDLGRLFRHLQKLLEAVEQQAGTRTKEGAASPKLGAGAPRSDWMVERLERIDAEIAFFFDELQLLHSGSILAFFRNLLERLPENTRVFIGSRTVPDIGLTRLVVNDQALVLRAQDLRFSQDEARAFFAAARDLSLSRDEFQVIYERSEGWPAAMQLYRLSLASQNVRESLKDLSSFRPRELTDYLADNVLGLQSPDVQDFLRKTAVLRRLCAPLCNAVLERDDAQQMLTMLERGGLFLRSLDAENMWFKYHTLFSSFLAEQQRELDPDVERSIHRRAADWHAANGLHEEAMHHAMAAREFDLAARVLEDWSTRLIMDGNLMTVERWYDRLSLDDIRPYPDLLVKVAYALAFLRRRQKLEPVQRLLERCASSGDDELAAKVSVVRSMILIIQDDMIGARDVVAGVDLHADSSNAFRAFELGAGANLRGYLDIAAGDSQLAHHHLILARALSESAGAPFSWGYSVSTAGVNLLKQGLLQEALEKFRHCAAEPRTALDESVASAALIACYVHALYESNALEDAQHHFEQFREVIRNAAPLDYMALAYVAHARIFDARGLAARAQECLDEAESVGYASNWPRLLRVIGWERVRRAIVRGEIDRAEAIASRISTESPPRPEGWLPFCEDSEGDAVGRIRLAIAGGRSEDALQILAAELPAAIRHERVRRQIKLHTLEGLARRAGGDADAARMAMHRALELAAPGGFLRSFSEEGPEAIALIRDVREAATESPDAASRFAEQVLALSGRERARAARHLEGAQFQPLEPLTDREKQILELVAGGSSNRKTADAIFVSENTVKFHLKNVYSKLGVGSRAQAINAAHQLGII